jgi:hypothetical protein
MPERLRLRLMRAWPIPLCAAALLLAPATASAAPKPQCGTRVNDTASELVECINTKDLMGHLQAFQDIADANPSPADGRPSRNSGEPGYKASVDYVANAMTRAGYDVSIQTYKFDYYAYSGAPSFSEVFPTAHDYVLGEEWGPGQTTGTTPAGMPLQPVGGIILPPTATSSSTSGCTAADFSGFTAGNVALIQRGGCKLRCEGPQREGGRCQRRGHLQRGQSQPDRADDRKHARRQQQRVHPGHPGRLHDVRHRPGPL